VGKLTRLSWGKGGYTCLIVSSDEIELGELTPELEPSIKSGCTEIGLLGVLSHDKLAA
jgi:hypothetical protein